MTGEKGLGLLLVRNTSLRGDAEASRRTRERRSRSGETILTFILGGEEFYRRQSGKNLFQTKLTLRAVARHTSLDPFE